jgi:hypothetical protein
MRVINALALATLLLATAGGCYVYTAAPTNPAPGTELLLELSDKGRVGLGDSVGSGAQAIEGTTVASTDTSFALRVSHVSYLNGLSNKWSGENLLVSRDFVSNAKEKKFSSGRTWTTAAAVGAALVAFIASRGLFGSGTPTSQGGTGPPNQN